MVYGTIALLGCFLVACWALFRTYLPPPRLKDLRRAFEALEEEFEDQRDHVRTALGRISRLKRSMIAGDVPPEDESAPVTSAPALADAGSPLTPRQQHIQRQILARRKGGPIQ